MSDLKEFVSKLFDSSVNETLKQNDLPHYAVRLAVGTSISMLLISLVLNEEQFTTEVLGAPLSLWALMAFVFYFVGLVIDLVSISIFSRQLEVTAKDNRFFYFNREGNRYLLMKSIFLSSLLYVLSMIFYILASLYFVSDLTVGFIEYYGLFLSAILSIACFSYGVSKRQSTKEALILFREHEGRSMEEQLRSLADELVQDHREELEELKHDLKYKVEALKNSHETIAELKAIKDDRSVLKDQIFKQKDKEQELNDNAFKLAAQIAYLENELKSKDAKILECEKAEGSIEELVKKRTSEAMKELDHQIKLRTLDAEIETKKQIVAFFDDKFFQTAKSKSED
ncbi:MAG: hypothetical protein AAFV74_20025 [Pseudomonadota bacterium]